MISNQPQRYVAEFQQNTFFFFDTKASSLGELTREIESFTAGGICFRFPDDEYASRRLPLVRIEKVGSHACPARSRTHVVDLRENQKRYRRGLSDLLVAGVKHRFRVQFRHHKLLRFRIDAASSCELMARVSGLTVAGKPVVCPDEVVDSSVMELLGVEKLTGAGGGFTSKCHIVDLRQPGDHGDFKVRDLVSRAVVA